MSNKFIGSQKLGASALLLSALALAYAPQASALQTNNGNGKGNGKTSTTTTTTTSGSTTTSGTTSTTSGTTSTTSGTTSTTSGTTSTTSPTTTTTTTTTTSPTTTTTTTTSGTTATTSPSTTTTATTTTTASTAIAWGTFQRPFAADSPWNSRPVNPVFGNNFVIPTSSYYPMVGPGPYSTGIFQASDTDGPMTIYGIGTNTGVNDPDTTVQHLVTLPHWPANTLPATGSDGHCDIYDSTTGILHSFWQLKKNTTTGQWQANMYAWTPIAGKGWGAPAHFYHGARATAVPAAAGLIRTAEINDGLPTYQHALAMSLTYNALSATTPYIYPATAADYDAATTNTGQIPEGALMMLPPSYDTSKITNAALKKVADTLKLYGAYVVDRNVGTPFAIYVENGSGFDLMHGTWDSTVASQLDNIRANLRQVTSATSWVDGNGVVTTMAPTATENKLSMRGPWNRTSGTGTATFDSWSQSLKFSTSSTKTVVSNGNSTGITKVKWATIPAGSTQVFTVNATGGAALRMQLYSGAGVMVADTGGLNNGGSARVVWPSGAWFVLTAASGVGVPSSVSATLTQVSP